MAWGRYILPWHFKHRIFCSQSQESLSWTFTFYSFISIWSNGHHYILRFWCTSMYKFAQATWYPPAANFRGFPSANIGGAYNVTTKAFTELISGQPLWQVNVAHMKMMIYPSHNHLPRSDLRVMRSWRVQGITRATATMIPLKDDSRLKLFAGFLACMTWCIAISSASCTLRGFAALQDILSYSWTWSEPRTCICVRFLTWSTWLGDEILTWFQYTITIDWSQIWKSVRCRQHFVEQRLTYKSPHISRISRKFIDGGRMKKIYQGLSSRPPWFPRHSTGLIW